jgi:hypothetical protein
MIIDNLVGKARTAKFGDRWHEFISESMALFRHSFRPTPALAGYEMDGKFMMALPGELGKPIHSSFPYATTRIPGFYGPRQTKAKYLIGFLLIILVEGLLAQASLLSMRFDAVRGHLINYGSLRLSLAGAFFLVLAGLLVGGTGLLVNTSWRQRALATLDAHLLGPQKRLFFIQGALLLTGAFLFECFLLSYLAFPIPTRPLFFWASLTSMEAWLVLRISYAEAYRARPSLAANIQAGWNAWLPVQRKVFNILALLGLLYFLAFIPLNLLPDKYGKFNTNPDEIVDYPDVTKALAAQPTFAATVQNVVGGWGWQYGYPYLTISAVVLLVPRLVFGDGFASHLQLNIFLLRQFVSVLPMILALLLAVYLVTRFKSVWRSAGLFAFLLLVPGIVKYNHNYWHPDALIVLCCMLTIYFLQKDDLRFQRNFYLAAVFCGLAAAIKLWGLFFVLAIAGYLLAGLIRKKLTIKSGLVAGGLFILAMFGTIIFSSPSLMAPYIAKVALRDWLPRQTALLVGPGVNDGGIYNTGLMNWLTYFGDHFMKPYFFFFAVFALVVGSIMGSRKTLNRILLAWSAATVFFLAYFVAMKNFQYMLPVVAPLYCGAFLFPSITEGGAAVPWLAFLQKPLARKLAQGLTIAFIASQFVINLIILYLYVVRGR